MQRPIPETNLGSKEKSGLDTNAQIPTNFYCSEELTKITSSESALSRGFSFVNLTSPHKTNLHIRSFVDYYGGYAEHGRNTIFGLDSLGNYNIKLTPIKTPIDIDPIVFHKLNWFTKNPNFKIKDSIFLTIAGPGWLQKKYLSPSRKNIAWTMIESLEASDEIIGWVNNCDEVWCPTDADMRRFKRANVNLEKVHLGFDIKSYNQNTKPMDISNCRGQFVFGVLGSWNKRKGIKEIIQAFAQAFKPKDSVCLLCCCKYGTRPFGKEKENEERWTIPYEFKKYLAEVDLEPDQCPHIILLDVPTHETVLPHIMARFDCLVGFSMGESTWLPGLQCMAMAKPIIQLATDTNGFMEYLDQEINFLCERVKYIEADEELYEGTSEYYKNQKFAQGDIEELKEKMLYVYKNHKIIENNGKLNLGVIKMKDWTWKKSIQKVDELLTR